MASCCRSWVGTRVHNSAAGRRAARSVQAQASGTTYEVNICVHKTCKNQGSKQIAQFMRDLALDDIITVNERGCLGNCGNGPNILIMPSDTTVGERLAHVSTPARMAQALENTCRGQVEIDYAVLRATEQRIAGNLAVRQGDLQRAIEHFTKGLEANPKVGRHMLLANRSAARLGAGELEGALADAKAAIEWAPPEYTTAFVRQVETLQHMGRTADALAALLAAAERCPEFGAAQEYHALMHQLQHSLHDAHMQKAKHSKQAAKHAKA